MSKLTQSLAKGVWRGNRYLLRAVALAMIAVAFAMFAVRPAETGSVADGPIGMTSRLKHQRDRYDAMMRLGPNGLPPLALTKALQQAAAMPGPTSPTTWTFWVPTGR
jgi:hypothetical protein